MEVNGGYIYYPAIGELREVRGGVSHQRMLAEDLQIHVKPPTSPVYNRSLSLC